MKRMPPDSFLSRIRTGMADMHPTERRLAEAVLNFPGDMASYSASEIAKLAGVSNATVSRFVRKIGYASYDEARKAVREEGRRGVALLRFGTSDDSEPDTVAAHLELSRSVLDQTYSTLDAGLVDDLAKAILAAPKLWVAGFRAGFPLAGYLAWQVRQVLPQVNCLPNPGETLAESVATFTPQDVFVLIALRRAPNQAATLVEAALEVGAQTAVIGDIAVFETYPVNWRCACATSSNGPLFNHTGAFAVCNLLASRVVELSGNVGRDRLSKIEDMHDFLGEL